MSSISALIIKILGLFLILFLMFLLIAMQTDHAPTRAVFGMVAGTTILWVLLGGSIMHLIRERIRNRVQAVHWHWRTKFVLFAISLALCEETITTGMTNLAPIWGIEVGEAYITASANYFDVVLFHSVIVFIPMFICWGWLLSRYNFSSNSVFLLFGITGILGEAVSFGVNIIALPFWVYVYGLMVYLPVYTLPADRNVKPALWIHYIMAVVLPILCTIPLAILIGIVHPTSIHFPPIAQP